MPSPSRALPLQAITVVLRDILKVWDCFGFVNMPSFDKPVDRQLTTMSAGFAGATMPVVTANAGNFGYSRNQVVPDPIFVPVTN